MAHCTRLVICMIDSGRNKYISGARLQCGVSYRDYSGDMPEVGLV